MSKVITLNVCEDCEDSSFVWSGEELGTCWVCRRWKNMVFPRIPQWQRSVPRKYSEPAPKYIPLATRPCRFEARWQEPKWSYERGEYEKGFWRLVKPLGPVETVAADAEPSANQLARKASVPDVRKRSRRRKTGAAVW